MTLPTLFEWIERFDFLRGMPAAYLLLLAGAVVVVIWDWRVSLLALSLQYLMAGLLFIEILEPRLAIIKVLVGLFVTLMLFFTGRQVGQHYRSPQRSLVDMERDDSLHSSPVTAWLTPDRLPFRLLLALLLIVLVLALAGRPGYQLPAVPAAVNIAVFGLSGLGLLGLSLTTKALPAGMGLLMVMLGFELFYNSLEQSVTMLAMLAIVNLAITLTIAYLAQAHRPAVLLPE